MKRLVLLAATLLAACGDAPSADPGKPESYARRIAIEAAAGGGLQRLALPAAALVALQHPDLADLRVFDAAGKSLPIARLDPAASARNDTVAVAAYPVLGPLGANDPGRVALTIGEDNVARVIGIAGETSKTGVIAALLDTRKVVNPAVAVTLDVALPVQQPVEFVLESSADLSSWEPIGAAVLFRPAADAALLGGSRIALAGVNLKDRYVRVGWRGGDASVRGAVVTTAQAGAPQRIAVAASAPQLADPHNVRFELPFATRPAAVRIALAGEDGVVPVKLYGRSDDEARWQLLAAGTVRQSESAGSTIELSGPAYRQYRIEADERSAGFSVPPRLELRFAPAELLVQFGGKPPYVLAAGLAGAKANFFTPGEIMPTDLAPAQIDTLPRARASADLAQSVSVAPGLDAQGPRQLVLWGMLVLATLVLVVLLVRLMRANKAGPVES